jgi:hypothetical protein
MIKSESKSALLDKECYRNVKTQQYGAVIAAGLFVAGKSCEDECRPCFGSVALPRYREDGGDCKAGCKAEICAKSVR